MVDRAPPPHMYYTRNKYNMFVCGTGKACVEDRAVLGTCKGVNIMFVCGTGMAGVSDRAVL